MKRLKAIAPVTIVTPAGKIVKSQDEATIKIVKEKSRTAKTKEKGFIYKFQQAEKKLNAKEAKRLRGKLRRQLQAICNDIITANIKKEDLSGVPAFITFYKANYILNDLSLQSLTNSSDELKHEDINRVLLLAKKVQEGKAKK